jgi:hypothetical protein
LIFCSNLLGFSPIVKISFREILNYNHQLGLILNIEAKLDGSAEVAETTVFFAEKQWLDTAFLQNQFRTRSVAYCTVFFRTRTVPYYSVVRCGTV